MNHSGSLEGRPSRAGTRNQPGAVPQHDLTVRPDVDEQGQIASAAHIGADHAGRDISADVGGDTRQAVHRTLRVDPQPNLTGGEGSQLVDGRDEGHPADRRRGDTGEQVDHRAIPGHDCLVDLLGSDRPLARRLLHQPVERINHQMLQFLQAISLGSIDDARDHVLATGDLTVVVGRLSHHLPTE